MRAVLRWREQPPEKDGVKGIVYDVAFSPDGLEVIGGVGSRVLIFRAEDGMLLHSLKGHHGAVYCVTYSTNGKRFASGAADNAIIIWTNKGEGILKYSHGYSIQIEYHTLHAATVPPGSNWAVRIQALAYNPLTQQLASGTAEDFGLWSPEQKSVAKHKVPSKILTVAWTTDGQYLALGHYNGHISIRDKSGLEKLVIERTAPVWSLMWKPKTEAGGDILAVGCWDSTLSFYQLSGGQIGVDKELEFNPCCVSFFNHGEYVTVGGTDGQVHLFTMEGSKLVEVAKQESWIWSVQSHTKTQTIAVGCQDGSLSVFQLQFSTVHALHQDRYAYRDNLSDVVIQHLITEQKVCLKCRDYVKRIAVYKDKIAVQLPDKIIIHELTGLDPHEMHYQVAANIKKNLQCNLLVVTSQHVILCQEKRLQSYNFEGSLEREWILEANIRYIKVLGGLPGREGFLAGLASGLVIKIFIDNIFPITLVRHPEPVRCLDINSKRSCIALVDDSDVVAVYDLNTREKTFEQKGATSVAWNSEFSDMLCFTGEGIMSIRTGDFSVHKQKFQGFVVGFKCSKVFCLQYANILTIEVPQSASMKRYIERKDFDAAYQVACLGVTDQDWRELAMKALQTLNIEVAKKGFIRIRDAKYLDFVSNIARKGKHLQNLLPEVLAYQGRYQEAAQMFARIGESEKAMAMFSDLRQFDEAKKWADGHSHGNAADQHAVEELINRQAEWSEEVKDLKVAADMYIRAKKYDKAVSILGKHGWYEKLLQVVREVDEKEKPILEKCASIFLKAKNTSAAQETYLKMGDYHGLVQMYIKEHLWEDAFLVIKRHKEFTEEVQGSYAHWLADNDRFDEARVAFLAAGQPEKSTDLLQNLVDSAISQEQFADAGFYLYQMARESLETEKENLDQRKSPINGTQFEAGIKRPCSRYLALMADAEIYHAYSLIHEAVTSPFQTIPPSTIFNAARFLAMKSCHMPAPPRGVRLVSVFFVLATKAREMGAYKLARTAYQRLQTMRIPPAWQNEVDLQTVLIRSKLFVDHEDLLPICYRCITTNPLLNTQGDVCVNCGASFIRSLLTFEHLPVVEFHLLPGISPEQASNIIGSGQAHSKRRSRSMGVVEENTQVLCLDDEDELDTALEDPFSDQLMIPNTPIIADAAALEQLRFSEVMTWTPQDQNLPPRYFRIMDTSMSLCCGPCGHVFEEDEFEMCSMEHGFAPFSRKPLQSKNTEEM